MSDKIKTLEQTLNSDGFAITAEIPAPISASSVEMEEKIDLLKGYVSVYVTLLYYENLTSYSALICFIGHIFPIWLKFKGGKGVATYLGVILALSYKFFLIFGITWLVLSFLFRYASLSSIISSLIVFVYSYFFINNFSLILFIFFVIIIYTHQENIVRLKNSEESKIKL